MAGFRGNTVADSMSPAPPACCPSLPKHYVVWNCLGVVVAGFRSVAWVRCWFCCDIAGGMLFSAFALAVDRFVTIGRRTAQFCFGLLMRCLFLASPSLRPSRLLTHATRRALYTLAGTWEQIRTKILRAFGGMMAGPLVATCWGPLLIVL